MDNDELTRHYYPESNISGFTHIDGTVAFYNQILAVIKPTDVVLDFGAGRGETLADDNVAYRRQLCDLRSRCSHLDGCDVDPIILENPYLDAAEVFNVGAPLPYADNRFNLIVARYVFEHLDDPSLAARELLRVLKPGGIIAAATPNKWGYIGVNARAIPSRYHVSVLSRVQPERKPQDVFPTQYKLNTRRALKRAFGEDVDIFVSMRAPEPVYHFGIPWMYRFMKWLNKHTPDPLLPVMDIFVRKPM